MARAPRIILIEPGGARREVEIITVPFRIGRQAGNELTLRDSRISRQQARIVAADGEYALEDMGSRHGTYVNSEKVLRHELRPKDNVDFGMTDSYRFIYVGDAATLEELIDKVDAPAPTQSGSRELHLLADPKGELTTTVARDNQHNSIPHNLVQISSGVLKRVVNSRRELIVSDTGDDTAMGQQESVARLELHTVVCIPVEKLPLIEALDATVSARQGELLGVLYLDSHVASSAFSELDREVLRTLAREAANVIENARLFSASRDKARLDHEVEIASQIQRQLLPKGFPKKPEFEVDGFTLACHSVGGDCYDFVELTGGRHGFFVGDISGKGISASLLASVLQGVIYTTAALDVSPADLVARVNQFFTERSAEERYATLFYGVLDMTGKIKYVNAGHVPPLIRRKDRSLEALESVNLPAGLFPDTEFTGAVAQMYPGDFMVIYTDGVTEATNVAGELLEDAGLRKLLQEFNGQTVQELSEAIRGGVQTFTGGAPQSDDVTLVVIQFRGKQP